MGRLMPLEPVFLFLGSFTCVISKFCNIFTVSRVSPQLAKVDKRLNPFLYGSLLDSNAFTIWRVKKERGAAA